MQVFRQPLAIYFVWHPADDVIVKPLVEYCFDRFQKDISRPFSRSMNLPVFFRTSNSNTIPQRINTKAKKTIVFCFSNKYVTGDDNWRAYYDSFLSVNDQHVIPIALNSEFGFGLNKKFEKLNFIRLYDFEKQYITQQFFISATHEIYRFAFSNGGKVPGNDSAIKLFLSHTKYDDWAVETAKLLKSFIDNTVMHRFYDAYDIHISHDFEDEIESSVKDSTLISIQSDNYSMRYWCQKEILIAKKNNLPIIVVNYLKVNEDRAFPHSVNVPSVHIDSSNPISELDIHAILETALLETLKVYYFKDLLSVYSDDSTMLLTRPPEFFDITNLLTKSDDSICSKYSKIIYPDPPVYRIEHKCIEPLGIKACTPLTLDLKAFAGISIGISISDPEPEELLNIGQTNKHLISLSQTIARHLLFRDATVIYGGDLRQGGFTEFLCEEAKIVQDRLQESTPLLHNYLAWPIYTSIDEPTLDWNAKNNKVVKNISVEPPVKVQENHDKNTFLRPIGAKNCFAWSQCLTKMRKEMIAQCNYRISAGGRFSGYKGKYPGVLEEISITLREKKPLYLLGGFGGVTSKVCELLEKGTVPVELTIEWQLHHNANYKDLVDLFELDSEEENIGYESIIQEIRDFGIAGLSANNGLSEEENRTLFCSEFTEEVVLLILKGIKVVEGRKGE